ncbi:hypothetical protein EVAR_9648_1 [Eumeta japonica]|uniref:Uncharacterized protein n=1 Tax=Eumeta variegata TaxID=151549 RepID=A0A4C1TMQ2_EUMVA|nr:hypothetical protein EVAR_9648_1 [Eumeta japonica]
MRFAIRSAPPGGRPPSPGGDKRVTAFGVSHFNERNVCLPFGVFRLRMRYVSKFFRGKLLCTEVSIFVRYFHWREKKMAVLAIRAVLYYTVYFCRPLRLLDA